MFFSYILLFLNKSSYKNDRTSEVFEKVSAINSIEFKLNNDAAGDVQSIRGSLLIGCNDNTTPD